MKTTTQWTQLGALELCRKIEAICPDFGCHVALTGGLLYKDGPRKDADILFYRIREVDEINISGLMDALQSIGVIATSDYGWCYKAVFTDEDDNEYDIDFFFPDREGEYPTGESSLWNDTPEDNAWLDQQVAELKADASTLQQAAQS